MLVLDEFENPIFRNVLTEKPTSRYSKSDLLECTGMRDMATRPTIERICQAAIRTATRDGLLAMTLDNVAKEAGVSKGGVMYHFPSKEHLVTKMLSYYSELVERMLMTRIANDPEPHRRWARAMLSCLFSQPTPPNQQSPGVLPQVAGESTGETADDSAGGAEDDMSPEVFHRFMLAVLAAAVNNPGIFEPLRKLGTRMRDRLLSDPNDGLEQLLIWLAVDGLLLWQYVGMIDPADPVFQKIGIALQERVSPPIRKTPTHQPRAGKTPASETPATKTPAKRARSKKAAASEPPESQKPKTKTPARTLTAGPTQVSKGRRRES